MKLTLCMLCIALALMSATPTAPPESAPLSDGDFAVELPGGTFNMATDAREELERVTGQAFEFYDEFPNLGISYDRLLTDTANFFADVGSRWVTQVTFKEGCLTARGIGLGSTQGQVSEAYAEPSFLFEEHGYIRVAYNGKDDRYELHMLIDAARDRVVDIHMNGSELGWQTVAD